MIARLTEEPGPDCKSWLDLIDDARDSISSIADYLAGKAYTWIYFDFSQLENTPTQCNLDQSLAALR